MHKSKAFHFMNNNKKYTHVISHPDQEIEHDLGRMGMRCKDWSRELVLPEYTLLYSLKFKSFKCFITFPKKKALKYGKINLKM